MEKNVCNEVGSLKFDELPHDWQLSTMHTDPWFAHSSQNSVRSCFHHKIIQAASISHKESQYKRSQRWERQSPRQKAKRGLTLAGRDRTYPWALQWLTCLLVKVKYGIISKISRHQRKYGLRLVRLGHDAKSQGNRHPTRRVHSDISKRMSLNAGNRGTVPRRYIAKDQKPQVHCSEYLKTRWARFGVTDALYVL